MEKKLENAKIIKKEILSDGIISMWLSVTFAKDSKAGQFIAVYCDDKSRMLPRPISICEIDKSNGLLRIVFRLVGEGTKEFSLKNEGDSIRVMGPLGNGYKELKGTVMVVGGGIGIPPMLGLSEAIKDNGGDVIGVLGYRHDQFLRHEFEKTSKVYIATDDGSDGVHGTVIDAIKANALSADVICACGPTPMLRALKSYAKENGIKLYVSLEEKMGCGIGACLACTCKSKDKDEHTNVNNKRICKEGPVFDAEEVEF